MPANAAELTAAYAKAVAESRTRLDTAKTRLAELEKKRELEDRALERMREGAEAAKPRIDRIAREEAKNQIPPDPRSFRKLVRWVFGKVDRATRTQNEAKRMLELYGDAIRQGNNEFDRAAFGSAGIDKQIEHVRLEVAARTEDYKNILSWGQTFSELGKTAVQKAAELKAKQQNEITVQRNAEFWDRERIRREEQSRTDQQRMAEDMRQRQQESDRQQAEQRANQEREVRQREQERARQEESQRASLQESLARDQERQRQMDEQRRQQEYYRMQDENRRASVGGSSITAPPSVLPGPRP